MKRLFSKLILFGLFAIATFTFINSERKEVGATKTHLYECTIEYFGDGSSTARCGGAGSDCEVISDCSNCW